MGDWRARQGEGWLPLQTPPPVLPFRGGKGTALFFWLGWTKNDQGKLSQRGLPPERGRRMGGSVTSADLSNGAPSGSHPRRSAGVLHEAGEDAVLLDDEDVQQFRIGRDDGGAHGGRCASALRQACTLGRPSRTPRSAMRSKVSK